MFKKRQDTDPLKPKKYVPILYAVVFLLALVRLTIDLYRNDTDSLGRNIIMVCFTFSLVLFSWVIFKKHSNKYKKNLDS